MHFWLPGHTVGQCSACHQPEPQMPFHSTHLQFFVPQSVRISGLPHPRFRIWHLILLNFIILVIAQSSILSRSLCKAFPLSRDKIAHSIKNAQHLFYFTEIYDSDCPIFICKEFTNFVIVYFSLSAPFLGAKEMTKFILSLYLLIFHVNCTSDPSRYVRVWIYTD